MNAKKLLALSLACTLTLGLSACGGGQDAPSSSSPSGASDGDALKVGIILSTGGLGDKNFNDMTYAGAQQAEKDFGIEFDYVETQSASDFLPNYRMFAESGEYDLIIGLAADQTEAINEIDPVSDHPVDPAALRSCDDDLLYQVHYLLLLSALGHGAATESA